MNGLGRTETGDLEGHEAGVDLYIEWESLANTLKQDESWLSECCICCTASIDSPCAK